MPENSFTFEINNMMVIILLDNFDYISLEN